MIDPSDIVICYECGVLLDFTTVWGKLTPGEVDDGVCHCPVCKSPLREKR